MPLAVHSKYMSKKYNELQYNSGIIETDQPV